VSRVWPIRRQVRYILCWQWDWLDNDQVILTNLFEMIWLCQSAVQSMKACWPINRDRLALVERRWVAAFASFP